MTPNTLNTFSFPSIIEQLDELLQLCVCLYLLLVLTSKKITINIHKIFKTLFLLFFLLTTVSFLINKSGIWSYIQFLIIYFRPIILILFAAIYFDSYNVPRLIKGVYYLFIVQIFLNYTWVAGINPIPHWKDFIDISTGTFESVMPVAYLCVFIIYFLIAKKLVSQAKTSSSYRELLFLLLVLIQLYITFTSHAILLGVLGLVGFFFINSKRIIKYAFIGVIVFGSIGLVLKQWESENFKKSTFEILSPDNVANDRYDRLTQSIKILSFYRVLTNNIPEIKSPLLGAGPGQYASLVASRGSDLYRKYNDVEKLKAKGVEIGDVTSVTGRVHSGMLALLGDVGWLGFCFYYSILVIGFSKCFRFLKSKKHMNTPYPEMFVALIPSIIFYIFLDLIWDMGAFKIISIGFWIWFGIAMKEIYCHSSISERVFYLANKSEG